ncbi:hypothetical protein [Pseudomonas citronellolis]|uniref:hypothetical protein n=1 Tax=Pseudomonas citronellolis TaxID=53408 RepID=UPI0023E43905|nr:hypothetical protein [Pseudomonas citronellolis]MDF3933357.1 hypothetical protein [Pseudomonas citronellolis]
MTVDTQRAPLRDELLGLSQRSESAAQALHYATESLNLEDAAVVFQVIAELQGQANRLRQLCERLH